MDAAVVTALIVGSVTLVLGLVWYALRLIARVTRPDDTRTICGVSRLGTICKLSYLLGHPMPLLEAPHFSFFPARDGVTLHEFYFALKQINTALPLVLFSLNVH